MNCLYFAGALRWTVQRRAVRQRDGVHVGQGRPPPPRPRLRGTLAAPAGGGGAAGQEGDRLGGGDMPLGRLHRVAIQQTLKIAQKWPQKDF